MAHSIASIAAQGWQVDPKAIVAMLITIQGMKFFLRTAFGDSSTHFGGRSDLPFQGRCQGNKGAPALWLVVSVCLIRLMHKLGMIAQLMASMTAATVTLAGFLFVDDTDLISLATSNADPVDDIVQRLTVAYVLREEP